jgi:hypothetical protein
MTALMIDNTSIDIAYFSPLQFPGGPRLPSAVPFPRNTTTRLLTIGLKMFPDNNKPIVPAFSCNLPGNKADAPRTAANPAISENSQKYQGRVTDKLPCPFAV